MVLAAIVAKARNGVIGRDNALPWHIPGELQYFKRMTLGKAVIMGRKTCESLGRPLPQRDNIVVTRNAGFYAEGFAIEHSLESAIERAQPRTSDAEHTPNEIMIIGGAQLYQQALPGLQRLYITEIHRDVTGDAYFPALDSNEWQEVRREPQQVADERFDYVVYERL